MLAAAHDVLKKTPTLQPILLETLRFWILNLPISPLQNHFWDRPLRFPTDSIFP